VSTALGGAPAPTLKSHAKLAMLEPIPAWAETLPDGRNVRAVDPNQFSQAVRPLGLGLDQSLGHEDRVRQYIEKLREIYHAAGVQAVARFKSEAPK
jgi:hypothetical protein